ncbi:Mobile element protein [Candidatus Enterovibrio altilux]|uniref:Mobile element protein n=1 Tax=Candidatus Enterovibrio altilux TaxID=1927128 RepID=A0A291BB90_9GAMM|nr:Mobile element protein [Candidatus Enterovibrio luxaltus]
MQLWNLAEQSNNGRLRLFSDLGVTTIFMIKHIFSMLLRGLQGFINSVFKLVQLTLSCNNK